MALPRERTQSEKRNGAFSEQEEEPRKATGRKSPEILENEEYGIRETRRKDIFFFFFLKGHFKKEAAANTSIWCSQAVK